MQGDLQTAGVDYLETYAPAVQMSTAQLALTTIIPTNFYTKQVEYTNVFSQSDFKEEVYIYPPYDIGGFDGIPKVPRLLKSLYGICQPPPNIL